MLRPVNRTYCLGLAWAIALGASAVVTAASPRESSETNISFAGRSASVHHAGPRYRTVRRNTAVSGRGAKIGTFARRRNRSAAVYRSGAHSVAQISPTILHAAYLSLEDDARPLCAAKARRRSACRGKPVRANGLSDALLQSPSPATEPILRAIGIPVIKDVPPIVILRAGHPVADENATFELR